MIVNLRDDVEFHQGWGKMTADDVVYSYNDANVIDETPKADGTTPERSLSFTRDAEASRRSASQACGDKNSRRYGQTTFARSPLVIFSKKVYDDKGP